MILLSSAFVEETLLIPSVGCGWLTTGPRGEGSPVLVAEGGSPP